VEDQVSVTAVSRMTELEEADKDEVGLGSGAGGVPPPLPPPPQADIINIAKRIEHVLLINISK
tara:strand:+ start:103 stop:291 length:189 start_codon:yes stop_codon:yes gene_type:complete